jgi:hypothetical protein
MSKCVRGILQEEDGKRGKNGMVVGCDKEFEYSDIDNTLSIMHTGLCQECNEDLARQENKLGLKWNREDGRYEKI